MPKTIVFQKSFQVSGIMCFDGCGATIQMLLKKVIDECKDQKLIPADAQLIVDAEPSGLGVHQLTVSVVSENDHFIPAKNLYSILSAKIKEDISFEVIDEQVDEQKKPNRYTNGINILVNLLSMGVMLALTFIVPPSFLLTIGLTSLTFIATLFTSRDYLLSFVQNFRTKRMANMATTISLGWFLSMAHTLFHAINMPLAGSFSMVFMNYIMPTLLIACVNGMDELKRLIVERSKKIQLQGIKTLFPQMSETYACRTLPKLEFDFLVSRVGLLLQSTDSAKACLPMSAEEEAGLHRLLDSQELVEEKRMLLREQMIIDVNPGVCFPVDCILIKGTTVIDASLLTGEPHQSKTLWQFIPAGSINLAHKVSVYAVKDSYNSTVNTLLFRSNRAKETIQVDAAVPHFAYFYTALIIIGLIGALVTPIALGVATVPLLLQNVIGILFSVCPCTIAIGHQLPQLISLHHRSRKGIHAREEGLLASSSDEIHTVVFDKTGTLTTGNSMVESSDIPMSAPLWQRIYLLEKTYGRGHPLAKAIQKQYETYNTDNSLFDRVENYSADPHHRGFLASVQGKTIQLGSFSYLKDSGIRLPEPQQSKIQQGFSAVCVAEDGVYKGIIYVKHEVRKGILAALTRLKNEGKKIIMLTGDNDASAQGFNKQMNSIFAAEDIHAGQTPQDKEAFLASMMTAEGVNPKGVWFIGDGLNDAPCCRIVSEKGGVSCAMDSQDKSAFFTDITLNGSLDYVFEHHQLNRSLQHNLVQNKGILVYSSVAFFAFLITFSIAGIAVSPLIPMAVMLSTTLFVLFNSYRTQLNIDSVMDKQCPWYKKLLGSNASIAMLLAASALLICGVLTATLASGGLALAIVSFTAGAAMAVSSVCTLVAITLAGLFGGLLIASLIADEVDEEPANSSMEPLVSLAASEEASQFGHDDFFLGALNRGSKKSLGGERLVVPLQLKENLDSARLHQGFPFTQ